MKYNKSINILVNAGFPSPAEDFSELQLDLQDLLIQNKIATYVVQVRGHSMTGAGIFSGDYLIVDRSLTPARGNVVVAILEGGFVVKRYTSLNGTPCLLSEKAGIEPIPLTEDTEYTLWGVVTYVLHKP